MTTLPAQRRVFGIATLFAMSGCLSTSPFHASPAIEPELRPEAFFLGVTHGVGTLDQRGKAPRKLRVEGLGRWDADSVFRLDQKVTFDDGATESRTWYLRRKGQRDYTGTLSDASGPMTGQTNGNVFQLRYRLRQPAVYMDQKLYLQSDGVTILNIATVSVLGVAWARLSETITRADSRP